MKRKRDPFDVAMAIINATVIDTSKPVTNEEAERRNQQAAEYEANLAKKKAKR